MDEIVRRAMQFVMSNALALQFNVYGRFGKKPFGQSTLFCILYGELTHSCSVSK